MSKPSIPVCTSLLPEDKVTAVHDLQREGHRVLLVGDGVDDAPALAAADLGTVTAVTRLSRRARRLMVQYLVIAGHEGSTILVALNGLRLLRRAEWKPSGGQ